MKEFVLFFVGNQWQIQKFFKWLGGGGGREEYGWQPIIFPLVLEGKQIRLKAGGGG